MVKCMLPDDQEPVKYGRTMKTKSGTMRSPPVRYPIQSVGLIPRMFAAHTRRMAPMPMKCASVRWTEPSQSVQVDFENHCVWMRLPTTMPKFDSTVDQANQ